MDSCLVVYSGGMDSTVLLHLAVTLFPKVAAISFDYGQRHAKELDFAKRNCVELGVPHFRVDLPVLKGLPSSLTDPNHPVPDGHYAEPVMKQTVVPNRNMVMLSQAAAYAIGSGYAAVGTAVHAGDHHIYPDCRPGFVRSLQEALLEGNYEPVTLWTPFNQLSKGQIARLGHRLQIDFEKTWSCYKGGDSHCGTCGTCVERLEAFQEAGILQGSVS